MVEDLKSVLERILRQSPDFQNKQKRMEVFDLWPTAVGEKIAKHAWPLKMLEDGLLLIGTEHSTWSQHLHMIERDLVTRLNKALGEPRIKGLRFCVSNRGK